MLSWLAHVFGLDDPNSGWYLFPSGWGSIFIPPVLTAVPIMWVLLRRHNCEVHGCWRIGRHQTAAGHMVCRRHHPEDHLTPEDITRSHERALAAADCPPGA